MRLYTVSDADARLQPVAVNRHIQSLLQHPQFSLVCQPLSVTRIPVVSILHGLFIQHPWNTSQPSHLQPLVAIYHGTLSACDQKLLAIFKLFEIHRKSSVGSLLTQWPATAVGAGATSLQALCSLDVTLVLRASLDFPIHRKMEDVSLNTEKSIDGRGVDPLFCLLLFCQMIADCPPKSALTWVELFRTNVVGLVIRCLSSRDVGMRELSLSALSGLYSLLLVSSWFLFYGLRSSNFFLRRLTCKNNHTSYTYWIFFVTRFLLMRRYRHAYHHTQLCCVSIPFARFFFLPILCIPSRQSSCYNGLNLTYRIFPCSLACYTAALSTGSRSESGCYGS